jgi:hypothetical protein
VVVAETLLVYRRTSERVVSIFVQQVLGVFEHLRRIFFNICYNAQSTVANVGREHRFCSKE